MAFIGRCAAVVKYETHGTEHGTDPEAVGASSLIREDCAQGAANVLIAGQVFNQNDQPSHLLGTSAPIALMLALKNPELGISIEEFAFLPGRQTKEVETMLSLIDWATIHFEETYDQSNQND